MRAGRTRGFRWLARIMAAAIGVPLVLAVALLIFANAGPGRALIERIARQATRGEVAIEGLHGRFPDALRADRVSIRDAEGVWLSVEGLVLDWSPLRLATGEARIDRLAATRVVAARLPVSSGNADAAGGAFKLPLRIDLETIEIPRLELGADLAGTAAALAVHGSATLVSWQQGQILLAFDRLDGLGSYRLEGRLDPAAIEAHLTAREPAHGLVSGLAGLPELGALSIEATVQGPRSALVTTAIVSAGALTARMQGTVDLDHQAINLGVTGAAPAMSPRPDLSWSAVTLDAQIDGPFNGPSAAGRFEVDALRAGGASIGRIAAELQGNAGEVRLHAMVEGIALPGPRPDLLAAAPLEIAATARLDQPERPITLSLHHPLVAIEASGTTAGAAAGEARLTLPDLAPLAAVSGLDLAGRAAATVRAAGGPSGPTRLDADAMIGITGGLAPLPALIGDSARIVAAGTIEGPVTTLSSLEFRGKALDASVAGAATAQRVDLDWKIALAELKLLAPTLSGPVRGEGHLAGPPNDFAATAELSGNIAVAGMPRGEISASLNATGLPGKPQGQVTAQGTLAGAPLALAVTVQRPADGGLRLAIERADWKSAHAAGAVMLAPGASFPAGKVEVRFARLDDLTPLLGRPLAGEASATLDTTAPAAGNGGTPLAQLRLEARDAALVGTASVGKAVLTANARDPLGRPVIESHLTADGISAGGATGNARLDLGGPLEAVATRLTAEAQNLGGAAATLTGAALIDAKAPQISLSALQADWKGESLRLLAPVRVGLAGGIAVDRLRLAITPATAAGRAAVQPATLEAAGRIAPALDLTVAVRNLTPALAEPFLPGLAADGTLRADARLTGSAAQPTGTIRLDATGLHVRRGPGQAIPPANLAASADLTGSSAHIQARLTAGHSADLSVSGVAPLAAAGVLDLHAGGTVDLAMLDPLLSAQGRRMRGRLTLDAGVAGSPASPHVAGTAALAGGEVEDFGQGLRISDIGALIQAEGQTLRLVRFQGTAGPGTIAASGTIGVLAPGMPIDIAMTARNAQPLSSDRVTARLDADLSVRGSTSSQLAASGTVRILHAEIGIPERMPAQIAVLDVRVPGKPAPAPAPPGPAVGLAVTVTAPGQIFVRGRGLFAELGGTVRVAGTTTAPQPLGRFHLVRGTFSLAGQTLTFNKGEVGFDGASLTDPSIDFVAQSTNGAVTATITVTGTASKPKIALTSTPDLPQDEILSQLLFGKGTSSLSPFEIAEIASTLAELTGVTSGVGDPLGGVRKRLGLDRLSVGSSSTGSPSLEAGRYVAQGVYVGAVQGAGSGSSQAKIEVDITKGLKLEGTVGTGSNTTPGATAAQSAGTSLGLKYQFDY
ncbi:MAG: translocation/assembly module TamB domain-containing protein [Alphaproteobacteria bacterium]|nr:translocation/assembly module TamB domain-containing protein [Alphaproteobacteria bacterium]